MSKVTNIRHAIPVSAETTKALTDMDTAIGKAIDAAKAAGLPQGFVVAVLHGHALSQTQAMIE